MTENCFASGGKGNSLGFVPAIQSLWLQLTYRNLSLRRRRSFQPKLHNHLTEIEQPGLKASELVMMWYKFVAKPEISCNSSCSENNKPLGTDVTPWGVNPSRVEV